MNLRLANIDDVIAIRAVARRAYIKYVPRIDRVPAPMAAVFLPYMQAGLVHVVEQARKVVGYLIAFARDDDCFVENIAVDPSGATQNRVVYQRTHAQEFPLLRSTWLPYNWTDCRSWFSRVYLEKDLSIDGC